MKYKERIFSYPRYPASSAVKHFNPRMLSGPSDVERLGGIDSKL
jgi:hypothetical protein